MAVRRWRFFPLAPPAGVASSGAFAGSFGTTPTLGPGPNGSQLLHFGGCHACTDVIVLVTPGGGMRFIPAPGMSSPMASSSGLFISTLANGACGGAACGAELFWTGGLASENRAWQSTHLPGLLSMTGHWWERWRATSSLAPIGPDVGTCYNHVRRGTAQRPLGPVLGAASPNGDAFFAPLPASCVAIVPVPDSPKAVLVMPPNELAVAGVGPSGDIRVGPVSKLPLDYDAMTLNTVWSTPAVVGVGGRFWTLYGGAAGAVRLGAWSPALRTFHSWAAPAPCRLPSRLASTRAGVWLLQPANSYGKCPGVAELFRPTTGVWSSLTAALTTREAENAMPAPNGDLWLNAGSGALRIAPSGTQRTYRAGWKPAFSASSLFVDTRGNVWLAAHTGARGDYQWALAELPAR